jgi:hypothetical protein
MASPTDVMATATDPDHKTATRKNVLPCGAGYSTKYRSASKNPYEIQHVDTNDQGITKTYFTAEAEVPGV